MDPDIVRQQEEAEREALALLAKKAPAAASGGGEAARSQPPVFFNVTPPGMASAQFQRAKEIPQSRPRYDEPTFISMGRLMSYGLAGGMLGGGLGITATNYWALPMQQANLAIFGPAGALALFCAFASFFVGRPPESIKR